MVYVFAEIVKTLLETEGVRVVIYICSGADGELAVKLTISPLAKPMVLIIRAILRLLKFCFSYAVRFHM